MGAQAVLLGIVLCVEDDSTSESREPVKLGKHQYFHVPAHVARRHCLAGGIDEPERRSCGEQ